MLEGKGLTMHVLSATYSILPAVLKWGPANCVVYTFHQDVRKMDFFPTISHKTSFTFQLLLFSDAMGPEDESCMDKVKEMFPRSKLYHLKVGNLQEIKKNDIPYGSVLESIPKYLHKSPCACQIL